MVKMGAARVSEPAAGAACPPLPGGGSSTPALLESMWRWHHPHEGDGPRRRVPTKLPHAARDRAAMRMRCAVATIRLARCAGGRLTAPKQLTRPKLEHGIPQLTASRHTSTSRPSGGAGINGRAATAPSRWLSGCGARGARWRSRKADRH